MSREYLDLFKAGNVDCLSLGNIEETSAVIAYLKGQSEHVVPTTIYNTSVMLNGVFVALSLAYNTGYHLTCINTFIVEDGSLLTAYDSTISDLSEYEVPYGGNDSYTFVITDAPLGTLINDNAMIDSSFIKAFGVKFTTGDDGPVDPPVIPVDPPVPGERAERTFVKIRDNNTYAVLAEAYDLMNTRIYEEINNRYTLDFNILPYENVYRIRHPNFLEINGDYFRIRRVEKKRSNTLMMAISCEHISYELNNQYELDAADEEIELPDYPYEGTPREILSEMLQGSRFSIGTVDFNSVVEFISKPMGIRSMIIGLANEIGAEVKWNKFSISLVARRGADRNVSFEVGKNLISMTEVYETHANGAFNRFYNVDVIDLSLIENEGVQEEMYTIGLGDTVTLTDEQFNIDINQRIISYEIDPFRKALPVIQLEHVNKDITTTINDTISSVTDLKRKPTRGQSGESMIDLTNYTDTTVTTSVDDDWVNLNPPADQLILVTGPASLIAGLKIMGVASAPSILEGVVKISFGNEVVDIENSRFKISLISGYNTVGIPFSLPYLGGYYQGRHINFHLHLSVSNGTFNMVTKETTMYLKGENIILEDGRTDV